MQEKVEASLGKLLVWALVLVTLLVTPLWSLDPINPIKMLALSFLILIGTMLVAEGCHQHVNKGYIYFAMAFSVGVEMLNVKMRGKSATKVELHQPYR